MGSKSGCQMYLAEPFHWNDGDFPRAMARRVTVLGVARWVRFYEAHLLAPRRHCRRRRVRRGALPTAVAARAPALDALLRWLEDCSQVDTFRLLLGERSDTLTQDPLFARWEEDIETTLCLTPARFAALRKVWQEAGLPPDLFALADEFTCQPWPGTSWKARLLRWLGVEQCLSPRERAHLAKAGEA